MPTSPDTRVPYVRPAYEPGNTLTMLELMRMASAAQSDAAGQRGRISADAYRTIGDLLIDVINQGQARQERSRLERVNAQHYADDIAARRQQFDAAERERADDRADRLSLRQRQSALDAISATPAGPIGAESAASIRAYGPTSGLVHDQDTLAARVTPGAFGEVAPPQRFSVRDQTPEEVERAQALGYQRSQAEAAAAARQADDDRLNKQLVETNRHNLAMERVDAARVTEGQRSTNEDAAAIAEAIMRGEQPPEVTGLYRMAGPVRAYLSKNGYDLSRANLDWKATQRHLNTLNGAQQTRLRQAVVTAHDSLELIEDLANQWDGGRFPLLNKANLAAAKNGAYGRDVASVATQLEGQITDLVSELGVVYMGGNSPTDHGLQLAEKNLRADWDKKVLLDMVNLARKNLQIRKNSIESVGPITSTPPAPARGDSSPMASHDDPLSVTAPNGITYRFPTAAAAAGFRARLQSQQ